ncbi:glycerate kinase [bacterium]|nr:MAG: glycerate kinase [bacterium]
MRVLVAPQEFKGSLSAEEAVDAIAAGIRRARPGWSLDLLPMSDGGPGFVDAMRRATRADTVGIVTHDALGRRLLGRYVVLRDGGTAMIEAAQANGLVHIRPEERDALSAGTFGVGELISAALAGDPPMVVVGVGGSATTDGGAGMARALGARFLDKAEHDLPPGGGPLVHLDRIHWERPIAFEMVDFVVATDVTNPLLGPSGAAAVYAPQKGASPEQVSLLERALERYAHVVERDLGISIASLPGGGVVSMWSPGQPTSLAASLPPASSSRVRAASIRSPCRGKRPGACWRCAGPRGSPALCWPAGPTPVRSPSSRWSPAWKPQWSGPPNSSPNWPRAGRAKNSSPVRLPLCRCR